MRKILATLAVALAAGVVVPTVTAADDIDVGVTHVETVGERLVDLFTQSHHGSPHCHSYFNWNNTGGYSRCFNYTSATSWRGRGTCVNTAGGYPTYVKGPTRSGSGGQSSWTCPSTKPRATNTWAEVF